MMTASTLVLTEPLIALMVDRIWERGIRLAGLTYEGTAITIADYSLGILKREAQPRSSLTTVV